MPGNGRNYNKRSDQRVTGKLLNQSDMDALEASLPSSSLTESEPGSRSLANSTHCGIERWDAFGGTGVSVSCDSMDCDSTTGWTST